MEELKLGRHGDVEGNSDNSSEMSWSEERESHAIGSGLIGCVEPISSSGARARQERHNLPPASADGAFPAWLRSAWPAFSICLNLVLVLVLLFTWINSISPSDSETKPGEGKFDPRNLLTVEVKLPPLIPTQDLYINAPITQIPVDLCRVVSIDFDWESFSAPPIYGHHIRGNWCSSKEDNETCYEMFDYGLDLHQSSGLLDGSMHDKLGLGLLIGKATSRKALNIEFHFNLNGNTASPNPITVPSYKINCVSISSDERQKYKNLLEGVLYIPEGDWHNLHLAEPHPAFNESSPISSQPHAHRHFVVGSAICHNPFPNVTVSIVAVGSHAHKHGIVNWFEVFETEEEARKLKPRTLWPGGRSGGSTLFLDRGSQPILRTNPVIWNPGEVVKISCMFDLTAETLNMSIGINANDEMCEIWVLYYTDPPMSPAVFGAGFPSCDPGFLA